MIAAATSVYTIHVVSFALGIIIGAIIMHYQSKAAEQEGHHKGFYEAWRIASDRRSDEWRDRDKAIEAERRVWQDRVHDLKNALHPEKLDKSSEARAARKKGGKRGGNNS